ERDESEVAGNAHGGDRLRPQSAYPIQVDQEVERLKDHRDQHEAGGLEQMPGDRPGGEVVHAIPAGIRWERAKGRPGGAVTHTRIATGTHICTCRPTW